ATHHVAPDHRAEVLLRWGDAILPGAKGPFGSGPRDGADQARRFGTSCDFVAFMPLPLGSAASDHGLLCVNHEFASGHMMFPNYADRAAAWSGLTEAQARIEMEAVGHSVVEIRRDEGRWAPVADSRFNRRFTATTPMAITGPLAGHERLCTAADPTGRAVLGTFANCAGGVTPWGTVLTAEENIQGQFWGDQARLAELSPGELRNHASLGIGFSSGPGKPVPPRHPWARVDERFDITREPREPNRFGYIVEIDPYDPESRPKKRTALGRFKHEGACVHAVDGRPVVVYMGDDERFQCIYRFVSKGVYRAGDRAANMDLLETGDLFVARFEPDGTGRWLKLAFDGEWVTPDVTGFADETEVLIEPRFVAGLLGGTPMDRPEDIEIDPFTGRVYVALTGNDRRAATEADPANPRAANLWGHILEIVPPGEAGALDHWADLFLWELPLLAGDPAAASPMERGRYRGTPTPSGWFANPDNLAFDPAGRLWIGTDGMPDLATGPVHDGLWALDPSDPAGAPRHFFGCPRGAECTGPAFTPDGTTLFVSIQHPGEEDGTSHGAPSTRWPDFEPFVPPRASVMAITRKDGGPVGG
ncbi:MAG: PhoX family phosphatase, partial [Alphaproteobacteria bacterium]|nr:PhoX family phosphatase [Alphaproteobacteria bacterium]